MSPPPPPLSARVWRAHAAPELPPELGPRWRSETKALLPRPRRHSRGRRFLVGALILSALVAALVWVILWLRPARGTAVLILSAGYEDNLAIPHNVYGREGARALAEAVRTSAVPSIDTGRLHLRQPPRQLVNVDDWDRDLARVPDRTILLFFALHGSVDSQGAYFLPQNALLPLDRDSLDADNTRLRLERVLERLRHVPRDRNVVLVLDVTQVPAHAPLGMLHNTFARELDRLDSKLAEIPNLVVLSASDADQRSWVCEEFRRTIFAHYLIEGLQGYADGAGDGPKDSKIDAAELHHYVSEKVARWARANRGAVQTPVLRPKGPLGLQRARKIHMTVVPAELPAKATPEPAFAPPDALRKAWQGHARLAAQVPAPWVYSPPLWRRYQDTLLRYEQLLEAGDGATAKALAAQLGELERQIDQAATLALGSSGNTLAMPSAGDTLSPLPEGTSRALADLWAAPPEEQAKRWAELLAAQGKSGGQALRLALTEMAVRETAAAPEQNLEKAAQLIRTLSDPLSPTPAEAHFLLMLRQGLPRGGPSAPRPPADLIRLALQVRLRAERAALGLISPDQARPADAYPYSAQVAPWIRPRIDAADKHRRLGQDLLFATSTPDWEKARELLRRADAFYRLAQEEAVRVRTAYAVRDQALTALPYFTQWLGRRALPDEGSRPADEGGLLGQVEGLWKDAHDLASLLETAGAKGYDPASGNGQWRGLADHASALRRALAELDGQVRRQFAALDAPNSPAAWRTLDDLLAVPGGDAKRRLEVLARKAGIGRKLQDEALLHSGNPPGVAPERLEELARKSAEVQGRLALASLGRRWLDKTAGLDRDAYAQLRDRLGAFRSEGWRAVVTAGDALALRRGLLPAEITRRLTAGGKVAPAKAGPDLRAADRLARLLDGPGSLFVGQDPAGRYRKHLVQELVLWQAERALEDNWYDEDPVKTPYYRVAGQSFVNDALRLDARDERIKGAEQRLAQDWKLKLVLRSAPGLPSGPPAGPMPVLHMTSESRFPLSYAVEAEEKGPSAPGIPVVWAEGSPALTTESPRAGQRTAAALTEAEKLRLDCVVSSPELREAEAHPPLVPRPAETEFSVRGLYRGRQFALKTPLRLHPLPENVMSVPPLPLTASVAVRAPREVHQAGAVKGAVAIILDCSGSMRAPPGQPASASKFAEAAAALKQVLLRIPKGTVVSVWVFGQAVEPGKTVENPEDTIDHLLTPTAWDPQDGERLKALMARVEACEPWNQSPILRAMWRAASEDLRKVDGFKTLLVITDGMDNRFDQDRLLNRDRIGPRAFLLANFRDIEVNLIGFKVVAAEQERALEQFKVIEELPLAGKFYTVEESSDLSIKIRQILRKRLTYRVEREDGEPVAGLTEAPRDVSRQEGNDQWLPDGLSPGSYRLALGGSGGVSRGLLLDRGDLVLVEATPGRAGSAGLRRVIYSEADHSLQPFVERGPWRLAVLQNQLISGSALQMLLTLERKDDLAGSSLQQARPALTWVEVVPQGGKVAVQRRWHYHAGYPAPAWSVESPAWPVGGKVKAAERPVVRVWWAVERPAAGKELERGRDFKTLDELVNRAVRVEEEDVVIEDVRVEQHLVETRQAFRDRPARRELRPCLVVRVGHAQGRPIQVRLRGVDAVGQEHRYYESAGKTTALFWPVTADQAELTLKGLEVISLTAFKRAAEKNRCAAELKNLYEPQASDTRPLEPVDLEGAAVPLEPTPQAPLRLFTRTPVLPQPPAPRVVPGITHPVLENGPYLPPPASILRRPRAGEPQPAE